MNHCNRIQRGPSLFINLLCSATIDNGNFALAKGNAQKGLAAVGDLLVDVLTSIETKRRLPAAAPKKLSRSGNGLGAQRASNIGEVIRALGEDEARAKCLIYDHSIAPAAASCRRWCLCAC